MRKCFYLELLIRNWSLSKMSLLQIDDSSRQWWKKEKNVGIVWLCLFPFASIFKTEKAQRAAVRNCNQKILQKWIRSCYNKMTASWKILFLIKKKKTKQNTTLLLSFFSIECFSVSQHSLCCLSKLYPWLPKYSIGFSRPVDQHSAAWSNFHLDSFLPLPHSLLPLLQPFIPLPSPFLTPF